jgi:large subunit ribosomal protein L4
LQERADAFGKIFGASCFALRAALGVKLREGAVVVLDTIAAAERKTKPTLEVLKRLGGAAKGKTLIVDFRLDDNFKVSARNIAGVSLVTSQKLTARDVMGASRIIASKAAVEHLQEVLR